MRATGLLLAGALLGLGCMTQPGGYCTVLECAGGMACVGTDPSLEGADMFCAWRCGSSDECAAGCTCGADYQSRDGGGACYVQAPNGSYDWRHVCESRGSR